MSAFNPHLVSGKFIHPKQAVTHFHLRAGDVVGDFGAGVGNFTMQLAEAVGLGGKVYALEIQKNLLTTLSDNAQQKGFTNINALWCDMELLGGIKLNDNILNVGVIVNTLFQIENKNNFALEVKRVLKPGAKLFVLDWSHSFWGMGPQSDQVISEQAARDLFEQRGFTFDRSFSAGAQHYGLAFRL